MFPSAHHTSSVHRWVCLMAHFGLNSLIGWHKFDDLNTISRLIDRPTTTTVKGTERKENTSDVKILRASVTCAALVALEATAFCSIMPAAASEVTCLFGKYVCLYIFKFEHVCVWMTFMLFICGSTRISHF